MTIRSFAPRDPARQPAFVGRPPVGEEGASYCVVRRYLWPDPTAPAPGEGDPAARPDAARPAPSARPRS
jgi:hypothetical protein